MSKEPTVIGDKAPFDFLEQRIYDNIQKIEEDFRGMDANDESDVHEFATAIRTLRSKLFARIIAREYPELKR